MLYTSFRVKRETYQKLRKLRNKLKLKSIDEVITILMDDETTVSLSKIIKRRTHAQASQAN
jgi:hypothetical protein